MTLSRSSNPAADPLSNVLDALGARISRLTRLEAAGRWALAFPAMDRLKFVALLRGEQWMLLPSGAAWLMRAGDVCLLGRTQYAVASDPDQAPVDGRPLYAASDLARLGGDDVVGIGGTVTFAADNADFLLAVLPDFLPLPRASPGSAAIATLLALMDDEIAHDRVGSRIVRARLADMLLVEAIRACADQSGPVPAGWLGALAEPRLGRALRAIHADVAQPWTVARLAGLAGMSRAAFAALFTRRVGQPPLAHLRSWRLTLARAALARGGAGVAAIAGQVGYASHSAFSHAYRREFGAPPKSDPGP